MGKHDQESAAVGARRATGAATGRGRGGRFSAGRKRETVLRLLRGEDLDSVSRELGITAARASRWRDQFLAAGQAGLKSRAPMGQRGQAYAFVFRQNQSNFQASQSHAHLRVELSDRAAQLVSLFSGTGH